jgi:hypothetical protein
MLTDTVTIIATPPVLEDVSIALTVSKPHTEAAFVFCTADMQVLIVALGVSDLIAFLQRALLGYLIHF